MIPLRDNAAPRRLTPINLALIAANIAVFIYELSLGPRLAIFARAIRAGAGRRDASALDQRARVA